jgi:hypothetical protein
MYPPMALAMTTTDPMMNSMTGFGLGLCAVGSRISVKIWLLVPGSFAAAARGRNATRMEAGGIAKIPDRLKCAASARP